MALNPEGREVVGYQSFCFWDRNSHRQSRVCHGGETNPLNPTFHVVFFASFPAADTVRYLRCNVGLCFSLWNRFVIRHVDVCLKNQWACCLHFGKLVLPFLGVQILGSSTETAVAWFLFVPVNLLLIIFERNSWSLSDLSRSSWCMLSLLSFWFSLSRVHINFVAF